VSQHLAVLTAANLVFNRQEGTRRLYQANPEGLDALRKYLQSYWGDLLDAFAVEAKKESRRKKK
jgi:DNA-binding transcriptional ArsR family regulator